MDLMLATLSGVRLRRKIHSSHGGQKAHLNFELKDHGRPQAARLWRVLDFKVQMRSSQPRDEWERVAEGRWLFPNRSAEVTSTPRALVLYRSFLASFNANWTLGSASLKEGDARR